MKLVEHEEKLVERSTTPVVDILLYRQAQRMSRLHSLVNPELHRTVGSVYESILELDRRQAEKDVNDRSAILPQKARRQTKDL